MIVVKQVEGKTSEVKNYSIHDDCDDCDDDYDELSDDGEVDVDEKDHKDCDDDKNENLQKAKMES